MHPKTGLVLVNLGSPDAADSKAVRRYLFEFLHDKRVIETSRWIWCPILHGIILRVRPARSARAYKKIWSALGGTEDGEAPLIRITRQQEAGVAHTLGHSLIVKTAMRYGNPSISSVLDELKSKGVENIAILPMYPQYAGATTGSVYDAVQKHYKSRRDVPNIRMVRDYHENPEYIRLLAASIREHLQTLNWRPDVILASFHGMPQSYIDKGDPYQSECVRTTELLRQEMGMNEQELQLTFQSRFGPMQWLQPYTDKVLEALPGQGKRSVAIVTPGFAADCLETLEEIDMEARETFLDAGGENFTFVPCLNDREDHVAFLADFAKKELLSGWLEGHHEILIT